MNVKEELVNLQEEQRKLKEFVEKYNQLTIDDNRDIRTSISDTTEMLQK